MAWNNSLLDFYLILFALLPIDYFKVIFLSIGIQWVQIIANFGQAQASSGRRNAEQLKSCCILEDACWPAAHSILFSEYMTTLSPLTVYEQNCEKGFR